MHKQNSITESNSNWSNTLALSLGFLPILFSWAYKEFISPRPFWGYFDHFETLYYSIGINLFENLSSSHADNPAGPLQILSALLVAITGADPKDYSQFLFLAHLLVIISLLAGALLLVKYLFADYNVYVKITGICVFFISAESIQYTHYWGPESFYFILGVGFFILFCDLKQLDIQSNPIKLFLTSLMLGLCIAEKFVFLVWVPGYFLALLIIPEGRFNLNSVVKVMAIAGVGVASGFMLVTFFLFKYYPFMFDWVFGLMTRDGPYGKGETTSIQIADALLNWKNYFTSAKIWLALMLVFFAIVMIDLIRTNENKKQKTAILTFIVCVLLFSLLAIARQMNLRYLLPMGLTSILLFYLVCQTKFYQNKFIQVAFCLVLFCSMLKHLFFDISVHNLRIAATQEIRQQTQAALDDLPNHKNLVVIYSFRFPTASFALRQHQHHEHQQILIDSYYPNEGHFIPYGEKPYFRLPLTKNHWDVLVIRQSDLLKFPGETGQLYKQIGRYSIILSPEFNKHNS